MYEVEVTPNLITYNSLVAASSRSGEWKLALALLSEMQDVELQPDQVTHNTTLVALRNAGLSRQALHAASSSDMVSPAAMDPYTFCALISACTKTAKWAKALHLVEDALRRFSLNKYVLSAGIAACAKGLQPQHAIRLLECRRPDAISCDAAVKACAATFLWAEALQLCRAHSVGVQSLLGAAFATSSSNPPASRPVTSAAQKRAVRELRRHSEGTWHDGILAESLVNYLDRPDDQFLQERARLLRLLHCYVVAPVLSQLCDSSSKVLQQQYGFGGLCKDLALQLGIEYPKQRLPSEWMGHEVLDRRSYGVLPREPVAQEMFVCLDYSIFCGKHCVEHLHVSSRSAPDLLKVCR